METSTTTEASALRTLLESWEKGLRTLSLYAPNNPIHQRTTDGVRAGLAEIWQQIPDLALTVTEAGLLWESELVLPIEDKSQSLGWTLFRDGIRWIAFSPGVEEEEIVTFLDLVQKARTLAEEDPDDFQTLLWSADFEFVDYRAAQPDEGGGEPIESSVEGEWPVRPTADEVQASVKQDLAEDGGDGEDDAPKPNAVVDMSEFESTLYFLDNSEIDYLSEEVRREYDHDLTENVLSMLFDIFETQPAEDARAEVMEILSALLPTLLGSGDFHSVAYLISQTQVVLGRAEIMPAQRRLLAGLTIVFSNPEAVEQLLEAMEIATNPASPEETAELFAHLPPAALSTVLKWRGRLSNEDVQQTLDMAIVRMATQRPHAVGVALGSVERVVVLGALRLVAENGLEGVEEQLGHLIGHDDADIRHALVHALVAVPTAHTMKALVRLVEDTASRVRTAAVEALAVRRFSGALPVLEEAVRGRELRARDLVERKAFFRAYAIIAGESSVSNLKGILLRRKFWRPEDPDTRACAAAALGNVESQSAREVLVQAVKDRDPVVRSAAMKAIRGSPK